MSASTAAPAPFSGKATATSVPSSDLFYTGIHPRNIGLVRKLLEVVLPVGYSEDFYRKLQEAPGELARLAYYRDLCVGVVGCRVEDGEAPGASGGVVAAAGGSSSAPPAARRVYMTVLAVLAPYRDRGIGSALLRGVLEALDSGKVKGAEGALEVYLHVWQENKEAIAFYERAGFVADSGRVENYYRRIENPHAIVLRRPIAAPPSSTTTTSS